MPPIHILDLPRELFCHVLSYLDFRDLVHSTEICRLFKRVVHESTILQLIIELGVQDMVPSAITPPDVPVHKQLEILKKQGEAWLEFELISQVSVPFHRNILRGLSISNGYMSSWVQNEGHVYELVWGDTPDIHELYSHYLPFLVEGVAIDPLQDLSVLISFAPIDADVGYHVYIRTFMTNEPHPKAAVQQANLLQKLPGENALSEHKPVLVGINGPLLLLCARPPCDWTRNQLDIWNWQTGEKCSYTKGPGDGFLDCCFLTSDTVLTAALSGYLEIYSFAGMSTPRCIARFALPSVNHIYHLSTISLNSTLFFACDPTLNSTSSRLAHSSAQPFFPNPDKRFFSMTVLYHGEHGHNQMFESIAHCFAVNMRVFLYYARSCALGSGTNIFTIPWSAWGPMNTRWFPYGGSSGVYGNRIVRAENQNLVVYQMNRAMVKRLEQEASKNNYAETPWHIVQTPEVVRHDDLYSEEVVTCLPYVSTEDDPGVDLLDIWDVIVDEGRILVIKKDQGDDDHEPDFNTVIFDMITFSRSPTPTSSEDDEVSVSSPP